MYTHTHTHLNINVKVLFPSFLLYNITLICTIKYVGKYATQTLPEIYRTLSLFCHLFEPNIGSQYMSLLSPLSLSFSPDIHFYNTIKPFLKESDMDML